MHYARLMLSEVATQGLDIPPKSGEQCRGTKQPTGEQGCFLHRMGKLTDIACKAHCCPAGLLRKRLHDGEGLYLEAAASGSSRWFWKYTFGGKERRMSFGSYPEVSLKAARSARDKARLVRHSGVDPVQERTIKKALAVTTAAATFETVARDLHATKSASWSATHARQWLRCLEKDLFPWLGTFPLPAITAPVLLEALRRVERRGVKQMPHDLREWAGQVFRYGIATGRCDRNPAADLAGALKPHIVKHAAALLEPKEVGLLLRGIDDYQGQPSTRSALALSPLLFQRPGNLRQMEWSEIDLDDGLWSIPSDKMKRRKHEKLNGQPHRVPLARQAVAILKDLRPLTGHGRFVFPSLHSSGQPMSDGTIRLALRRLGYSGEEMSAHGFRAMARTLMGEHFPEVSSEVMEAQLAHVKSGPLGSAYDRTQYMAQRRTMMQAWADYLDSLRVGAEIIPLKAA